MTTFKLNSKSKSSIKRATGMDVEKISTMPVEDLDKMIEKKIGKKLDYKILPDFRLIGRGSVYIYLNRLFSMDFLKKNLP